MKYLNALNLISGVGSQKLHVLMDHFGASSNIWNASESNLINAGISRALAKNICEQREQINVDKEFEKLAMENIHALYLENEYYPSLLKHLYNPPYILYARGNLEALKKPMVAIVGSRKLTQYGQRVAFGIARDLASAGVCVVSGLAFGVDAQAHRGALAAKGSTIAVLGNSVDDASLAPRSNYALAHEILDANGLLLSEFPVPTKADRGTFPARNRIMAGITSGTIVVEAALGSGSLITARHAIENNRDVFAVPGSIFSPQSEGCHWLISQGAKLITGARGVLDELSLQTKIEISKSQEKSYTNLSKEENSILSVLSHEPAHIDIISKATKLETSTAASTLVMLEMKGAVKNIGNQNYIRL